MFGFAMRLTRTSAHRAGVAFILSSLVATQSMFGCSSDPSTPIDDPGAAGAAGADTGSSGAGSAGQASETSGGSGNTAGEGTGNEAGENSGGSGGENMTPSELLPIPLESAERPISAWTHSLADLALADAYAECAANPNLSAPWAASEQGRGNPVFHALEAAMEQSLAIWREERELEASAIASDWLSYRNDASYNRSRATGAAVTSGLEAQSWTSDALVVTDTSLEPAAERAQRAVDAAGLHICVAERLARPELIAALDGTRVLERLALLGFCRGAAQIGVLQHAALLAALAPSERLPLEPPFEPGVHHVAAFVHQWAAEQAADGTLGESLDGWFARLDRALALYLQIAETEANAVGVQVPAPRSGAAVDLSRGSWSQRLLALLYGGDSLAGLASRGLNRTLERSSPGPVIDEEQRLAGDWPGSAELQSSPELPAPGLVIPLFQRHVAYHLRDAIDHRVPEAFWAGEESPLRVGDDQGIAADGLDADSMRLLGAIPALQQLRRVLVGWTTAVGIRDEVHERASSLLETHGEALARGAGEDALRLSPVASVEPRSSAAPEETRYFELLQRQEPIERDTGNAPAHVWRASLSMELLPAEWDVLEGVELLAIAEAPAAFGLALAASQGDELAREELSMLLGEAEPRLELVTAPLTPIEAALEATLLVPLAPRDAKYTLLLRRAGAWTTDYWPVAANMFLDGWAFQPGIADESARFAPIHSPELARGGALSAIFEALFPSADSGAP